jgi:hypothetical protein
MDILRFIAAHGQWKFRLRDAITNGKSEFTVAGVKVDNACEFGKFLHSLPPATQGTPGCSKVRAKHAEFHQEAARVLELALSGRKADAEKALAIGSSFQKLSSELATLMMDWQKQDAA